LHDHVASLACAADALFLCDSWASCLHDWWSAALYNVRSCSWLVLFALWPSTAHVKEQLESRCS